MMQKIAEVERLMAPILDGMQLRHLHVVLASCFFEDRFVGVVAEDDAECCVAAFLAAKRLEGCSERSLGYYASTLSRFTNAVRKRMGAVTTDEIRDYLSEYQSEHGASNVTVDNVRRILSSFFSWLEAEDFIYKSPVKRIKKIRLRTARSNDGYSTLRR